MKKKLYIQPRMDWEETVILQSLLQDSVDLFDNDEDDEVDEFKDLLDKSRQDEPSEETMSLW